MSRQLYDPVGINGVAQHELLQITQNLTDGMSPKVFAGVAVDTHAGMVDLYLANTSPGARESAMATVATAQRGLIRIHHVAMSETALNAAMASTGSAVDRLLAARVPVQSYYPDFMGGRIVVRLYRPTAAQRARAAAAVTSLPVRLATTRTAIVPVPPATAPARQGAPAAASGGKNRAFDKPAWTGGDFIDSTYSNFFHFCTDSWPIKIGSKQYITTAGHCSPSGHHWINMTLGRDGKTELGDKRLIGVGSKNELKSSHHLDVQVLKTSNMADVWSGQVLSNYRTKVRKSVTPPVGAKICDDGAYEGTICGIKVNKSDYNSCIVSSDGKMCHLYRAHRPKQKVAIGQGDSGGPDYIAIGSTSHVRSVKGVGLNSLETVANMKCPHFTWRGKVCSNVMFFTGLNKILKLYRAKLRTTK
jgi:Trypsin